MGPGEASGLTFYVERSLGSQQLAAALRGLEKSVQVHASHFPKADSVPEHGDDAPWIQLVGEKGWVGLTKDVHSLSRPLALRDIKRYRARIFALRPGRLPGQEEVRIMMAALPDIARVFADPRYEHGLLAHVHDTKPRVRPYRFWPKD